MDIGNKIYELRKAQNLSQEALAEKLGVARQTISKWELGETSPDLRQAKRLADFFGVSLNGLAGDEAENNTPAGSEAAAAVYETRPCVQPKPKSKKKVVITVLLCILIFALTASSVLIRLAVRKHEYKNGSIRYSAVECDLHGEKYLYEFRYYEEDGQIIEAGGDGYLSDIVGIEKYGNAYQAINVIKAYVENNGGTTQITDAEISS